MLATTLFLLAAAPAPSPVRLRFVINDGWFAGIRHLAPDLADHFFNHTQSVIFTNTPNSNPIPPGYDAIGGMKFPAFGSTTARNHAFEPTLTAHQIDPHVTAVIYDNESWGKSGQTPAAETANPAKYTAQFAQLAHRHRYLMIASPSRDLAMGQSNYPGKGNLDTYFFEVDHVPQWVASAPVDLFGVQAQVHLSDGKFAPNIARAANEAVAANPEVKIIPVLSTTYGDAHALTAAVLATHQDRHVVGYWINCPGGSYQEIGDFLKELQQFGF